MDGIAPSRVDESHLRVSLAGRITAHTAAPIWRSAVEALERNPTQPVIIDASRIEHVDSVGLALIFDLLRRHRAPGASVEIRSLSPELTALLARYDARDFLPEPGAGRSAGFFERLGRLTAQQIGYLAELLGFTGACVHACLRKGSAPRTTWKDVLDVATETGANAVPIVLLVGFLMGVIIAFELGLVARQFGAVIFVVNGGGLAVLRELGPLMTAIVVAGRTGAAFAAQIGAQKVSEELDALATYGLDPVEFLVLPRLLASIVVVPMLAVLADIAGLVGGGLVMSSFDVSFQRSYHQLLGAVSPWDLTLGLMKASLFGLTIALVGCHRGLATGAGATEVGRSATRAVVASIVLVIMIDGLCAVATS